MKKNIISIFWLALIISYNVLGLITEQITETTTENINASGNIITKKYQSDLCKQQITTYSFKNLSLANNKTDNSEDMLFALIPRIIDCVATASYEITEDKIMRMSTYINASSNCLKPTAEFSLIEIRTHLKNQKLDAQPNLENTITTCIHGAYGLYMPKNEEQLNKFNGQGRVLCLPVTTIDNLLLATDDANYDLSQQQTIELQKKLFEAVSKAKTTVFIPNAIATKASGKLRFPIAIINSVTVNSENQSIKLNLLFHKNTAEDFTGFYDFINARKRIIENADNTACEWEFIDYTFTLTANDDKHYYSFSNAELQQNGNIQQHDVIQNEQQVVNSNQNCDTENRILLNEARALTSEEQAIINNQPDNTKSPCSHYKRKCLVKLSCCDKYFPCHRCHNYAEHTDLAHPKKQKAIDTESLKCLNCDHEQRFTPETGQHCQNCHHKFADYYCGLCKHITGHDDNPYHCDKCGICRVHGERSFHCDVCGICLDVQLRNNHKCCENSAHDECCICFEDAFAGCKILPCSHKVHKYCATRMIRNGITRCPTCRESFAHKLERR